MDLGLILLAAAFLIALAKGWRWSVKIALVLVLFEGAIRKWLLPQASDFVYFLKDVVLLGAYIRYFAIDRPRRGQNSPRYSKLKLLIGASAVIVFFQAMNVRLNSSVVGFFGFKAYVWYIPLCFILPDLFRSEQELQKFLKAYLLLAIPICVLAVIQFFSPANSMLNTYVVQDPTLISTFGVSGAEHARVTGTFSYITGFTTYVFTCVILILPMLSLGLTRVWFTVSLIELLLLTAGMLMSGSRGAVFTSVIGVAVYLLMNLVVKKKRERAVFFPLIIGGAICIAGSVYWFDDALGAFWWRATTSDSASERITSSFTEPFEYILQPSSDLAGYGTGSTHPGGDALRRGLGLSGPQLAPPPAESEPMRVLLELGILGFLLWYTLRLYLVWALWCTWRNVHKQFLRHLAFAALIAQLFQLSGAIVLNHTAGVYFWFVSSFIFLLPRLDVTAPQRKYSNDHPLLRTVEEQRIAAQPSYLK